MSSGAAASSGSIHFEEHRMLTGNGAPVKPNTQLNGAIDYARRLNLQTNDETHLYTCASAR